MQLSKLPFALCLAASLSACVVSDGDTDTDAVGTSTDPATTDPATTDPATTDPATTDPATTDPATTDPATTDPATTDPSETDPGTESESETDVSTSVADSSGTDTGPVGNCGWDEANGFYACGFDGEDPDGNFPIECGEEPVAGAECDQDSPINDIGCCFEGGNAFCGEDGTIQIDDSCAAA